MDLVPVEHDPFPAGVTGVVPVDHDPFNPLAPQGSVAAQVVGFPQRAADLGMAALGPIGEAGMTVGDMLRTGHVDPRDIPQVVGGVMMGVAAPEAEEAAPLEAGAEAVAKGITAYHGSPYDFDKFDLSKIGTGEGAQAYGHGLYFAENPGTAQSYKESTIGRSLNIAGKEVPYDDAFEHLSSQVAQENPGFSAPGQAANWVLNKIAKGQNPAQVRYAISNMAWTPEQRAAANSALDTAHDWSPQPGKMYQVSINADPEHFLDWDKPLSEQSPKVQTALSQLGYFGESRTPAVGYHKLAGDYGGPDMAAQQLRQAGIPGIKYLDQGSRGVRSPEQAQQLLESARADLAKDPTNQQRQIMVQQLEKQAAAPGPTKNYVVFDDRLIDIVKKYGMAGLIAGGGAHFATRPVDHDPFAQ